ncbi:GGDEF domain-containing protein [Oceanicella sp. SM1341]|uniref:GGDEF domain-containing protein n=1 Tax=Oceanicella sp. SM1341 TaxID=1548889 RepID=UPI00130081EA|nr:GGDEF domain-containing protein [Oceanicella sp. SM1341]
MLVVIDIDHFKRINDSHGHAAGDEVLRGFSDFLRGRFGHGDTLCRIGGEEFVLVMPGTSLAEAHRRVEAARRALAGTAFAGGPMPLRVSFSAGLAAWGPDGESFDEVFARADTRLYAAKSAGRNRSVLSDREPA